MIYFELGMGEADYLTEREIKFPRIIRKIIYFLKKTFGVVLKKRIENKIIYVVPTVNKIFLKRMEKLIKINGGKQACISDELFFKEDVLNLLDKANIEILNSEWIKKYLLIKILDYLDYNFDYEFETQEIAILVNREFELAVEYIKRLNTRFKVITIVTNDVGKFKKIEQKYLNNTGLGLNIVNNYKKSLNKSDYVVNLDFKEKELKKYFINENCIYINLFDKNEIKRKKFNGINVIDYQISMPDKYLKYIDLFYNFRYLNVYESFIKKKTSIKNVLDEIDKDKINIVWVENNDGLIKKNVFQENKNKKILDK